MLKFLKILCFLILACVPLALGIVGLKKFYPEESFSIEEKLRTSIVKKVPFLKDYLSLPQKEAPKIVAPVPAKKEEIVEMPRDYLTNKEVYEAICEVPALKNLNDKFIGCTRCPHSLNKKNPDYFSVNSFALGSIEKKQAEEVVFFMSGCFVEENVNGGAFVLRKGFGGWQKVSQYKNMLFTDPPLSLKGPDGVLTFVAKRKENTEQFQRETLSSFDFKEGVLHKKDIFSAYSTKGIGCHFQFLSSMEAPEKLDENKFSVKLGVLGWESEIDYDCKIPAKKLKIRLDPGAYSLHFQHAQEGFVGDKKTQHILTELEKARE